MMICKLSRHGNTSSTTILLATAWSSHQTDSLPPHQHVTHWICHTAFKNTWGTNLVSAMYLISCRFFHTKEEQVGSLWLSMLLTILLKFQLLFISNLSTCPVWSLLNLHLVPFWPWVTVYFLNPSIYTSNFKTPHFFQITELTGLVGD